MRPPALLTAEQLSEWQIPDARCELVGGRLAVREPAGFRHGDVTMRLTLALGAFVTTHAMGKLVAAETGFTLRRNPDTVRAADIAFIARERLPALQTEGYAEMAPDLVVEVLSPGDRASDISAKCHDWLTAGCQLVWVVDPARRDVHVHRADGSVMRVGEGETLSGDGALPGFRYELRELFG